MKHTRFFRRLQLPRMSGAITVLVCMAMLAFLTPHLPETAGRSSYLLTVASVTSTLLAAFAVVSYRDHPHHRELTATLAPPVLLTWLVLHSPAMACAGAAACSLISINGGSHLKRAAPDLLSMTSASVGALMAVSITPHVAGTTAAALCIVMFLFTRACLCINMTSLAITFQRPRLMRIAMPALIGAPTGLLLMSHEASFAGLVTTGLMSTGATMLVARRTQKLTARNTTALLLADLVDERVPDRQHHSTRVAEMIRRLTSETEARSRLRASTWWAGRICDIGLLFADTDAMSQQAQLNDKQLDKARFHAVRSAELAASLGFPRHTCTAILEHHERIDGKGLIGRAGDHVHEAARYVVACDAAISMLEPRSYRAALESSKVAAILRDSAGTQFDEQIGTTLAALIEQNQLVFTAETTNADQEHDSTQKNDVPEHQRSLIYFDPDIPGDRYRQTKLDATINALADGRKPAIMLIPTASQADMSWLDVRDAEIWAPPTTVVRGSRVRLYRYVAGANETRVMNEAGDEHATTPTPDSDVFVWRGTSRMRAAVPVASMALVGVLFVVSMSRGVLRIAEVRSSDMNPSVPCGSFALDVPTQRAETGDVVVMSMPSTIKRLDWSAPDRIMSRVVAVPGDTVRATATMVYVNDTAVFGGSAPATRPDASWHSKRLGKDEYFVLGDRRSDATDSRFFGSVTSDDIEGRVIAILWPWRHLGTLRALPGTGAASDCATTTR